MNKNIVIKGAKENNLKNLNVTIPRDKMVVMTGLSGSGKSSLAFDTIYAEGQRKYMESLSSYARQFLGRMEKPNVETIEGLSPAISIDQKTTNKNPRSTVGTVTEIYDHLRLLYARAGIPHCPVCGGEITSRSVDQIVEDLMSEAEGTKLTVLAPVVRKRKGRHEKIIDRIRREGFVRVRIDGEIKRIDISDEEEISLEKNIKHTIEIVIDRIKVRKGVRSRLAEACELAICYGEGLVNVIVDSGKVEEERIFSTVLACPDHGISIEELEPRMFSFNNPMGACPVCKGLGFVQQVDPDLLIPDQDKSIEENCLKNFLKTMEHTGYYWQVIGALAEKCNADISMPFKDLPKKFRQELLYGTGNEKLVYEYTNRSGFTQHRKHTFEGLIPNLERRYVESRSEWIKTKMETFMRVDTCPECHGNRLRPELLGVSVGGKNIMEFCALSIVDAIGFLNKLKLDKTKERIAGEILKEIKGRLAFLANVGLDYLNLSRATATLSGGESQRIRLATQIGSGLVGVLYILDEPSIGLHQKDNEKLLRALRRLTDIGNTLIIVEHDEETIYTADHIVDIGPGAGIHGGELVAQGSVEDIMACPNSITGQYLSGKRTITLPSERRSGNGKKLTITGAEENNLKEINADIPLGKFVCVTGVSGSGKSSLINEVLYKAVSAEMYHSKDKPGKHKAVKGIENIDKIIDINQSPIGRTPRSNPATYTKVFDNIRDVFAHIPEAKMRGYKKGRFSFNLKGGRCESCNGDGIIKIEMNFLPDVYVPCEVCGGRRYNRETLEIKYKGKNIFDVLDMNVSEALDFFKNHPSIYRHLQTLEDVGLGYIKLGQPSTQLSGGEAQRIKLASELSKRGTGNTLYILDEPTTGLHFADVEKLLDMLGKLVDAGNTVIVIEHNLDVIKCADHIIDLGPDGGAKGGRIIAEGTPEEIAEIRASYTGRFLKK